MTRLLCLLALVLAWTAGAWPARAAQMASATHYCRSVDVYHSAWSAEQAGDVTEARAVLRNAVALGVCYGDPARPVVVELGGVLQRLGPYYVIEAMIMNTGARVYILADRAGLTALLGAPA